MLTLLVACTSRPVPIGEAGKGTVETGDSTPDTAETGHSGGETGETGSLPVTSPCTAWGEPVQEGAVVDEELDEISSVVASVRNPGVLWVLEDHGGDAAVYALDPAGNRLGVFELEGLENVDWEAMDVGPCGDETCLYVGDIGDNEKDRDDYAVHRVVEPTVDPEGGMAEVLTPESIGFSYPSGYEDAEALAVAPDGALVIVTKRFDFVAEIYLIDTFTDGAEARLLGSFASNAGLEDEREGDGAATSASMWPDGSRLLVRTYRYTWELALEAGGIAAWTGGTPASVPSPSVGHDEALGYDANQGGYWTIPEAIGAPIWYVPCG